MTEDLTVLVVDDDDVDRIAARRALRAGDSPVHVTEARNCAEAFAALEGDAPPDAVLLDYQLPDGDGLSVLRWIQARALSTPIIMLTGNGDEMVAVELMKAGAADYLAKGSLTPDSLWRSLRGALRLRQTEVALHESEERFRLLMENVLDYAIFLMDPKGRVSEWSAGAQRILGYRVEEIMGQDAAVIFTPEDRARGVPRQEMMAAAADGHADDERWHVRKDGRRFFASGVMTPLRDEAGHLRGYSKILRDVTERKQVEDVLRASEERYRSLVSATAQIVWTTSAAGEFDTEQPQWGDFTGQSFENYRGWGWLTAIYPDDQWRTAEAWSSAVTRRESYEVEHRLRRRDGAYRIMAARAVPVRETDGAVREWVGVHSDITEEKQAQDRLSFLAEASTRLAASLDRDAALADVAQLTVPVLADWCLVDIPGANGRLRRVATAHADPALRERAHAWAAQFPPDDAAPNGAAEVVRTGCPEMVADIPDALLAANARNARELRLLRALAPKSYLCVPLSARGKTLGAITLISTESGRRYEAADLELAEELAGRVALALDNARLYGEARARAERESLINKIGQTLRGSLDPERVLQDATAAVGKALGLSRCVLIRLTPDKDHFEVAPSQYAAPDVAPSTSVLPLTVHPPELLARWRQGETVAVADIASDQRGAFARDLPVTRPAARAFIAAPMFSRGEWVGLFVAQQTDRAREWTSDEVLLMASLADMLALALDNARQYTQEHRVADMLQAAFLPDIPDNLLGLDLAKSYSPGLREAQVGGDLYDAFALPDGRVALVIADVSGKGLGAAVQTATVKYSLRAFAAEAAAPGLVLRRLNRTLRQEASGLGEHFVTLFYAVYDPATGRLSYASAGHEAQLIKRAGGGTTLLPANGPILGITDHIYEQDVDYLGVGDSLVLFTDGLTEARAAGTRELLDLERVTAAVERLDPLCGAGAIVASLEQYARDWTKGRPQDDLALLAAQRVGEAPPTEYGLADRVGEEADGDFLFGFAFPSTPDYATEVRQAVAHWMGLLGFDRTQIEDFQTAVTEAVTNAVRHGSPHGAADQFRVSGYRNPEDTLVVEVADSGPGLPGPAVRPAMPGPDAPGGRGLPLMHVLADEVAFRSSGKGLCTRLLKMRPAARGK